MTITVALAADPPPAAALDEFTKETGITVNWVNIDWDSLQTKISAAATAKTYFADATDVDWSRVGQLGKLGWFYPMGDYLDVEAMKADMPQLASFTSAYLAHQDLEERVVMPALEMAVGVERLLDIHAAIVGPMPPDQMARSVALMLPAMNIDDRTEFFVGMAASAPIEAVDGMWGLAGTVLAPADLDALARRIGR